MSAGLRRRQACAICARDGTVGLRWPPPQRMPPEELLLEVTWLHDPDERTGHRALCSRGFTKEEWRTYVSTNPPILEPEL